MAAKTLSQHFERSIAAPIEQVYQAFTNSVYLREWLSDSADVQPHLHGFIWLSWYDGNFVVGRYTKLQKDQQVQMDWQHSFGLQSSQTVQVDLSWRGEKTEVRLEHSGPADDETWQSKNSENQRDWESSLDNLQSVLEEGIDLRLYARPMIGIMIDRLVTAESAGKEGLAVNYGVELSGTVEGMGAEQLGMGDGTIITTLNRIEIKDFQDLSAAVKGKRPGERIPVEYYQDQQRHANDLQLSARPRATMPPTPQSLAEKAKHVYEWINKKLEVLLEGVSAEAAAWKPDMDAWSAREVVAHLVAHEQYLAHWAAALENAKGRVGYAAGSHQLVAAIAAAYPDLAALRHGLGQAQHQNVVFLNHLPVEFVERKGSYHRLAINFLEENKLHAQGHMDQIQAALEGAKESPSG